MGDRGQNWTLKTRGSYFTISIKVFNHVLAENTYFTNPIEWTEHTNVVFKSVNKDQIIQQCNIYSSESITFKFYSFSIVALMNVDFSELYHSYKLNFLLNIK